MSPPRFVHRRITPEQFKAELDHHGITVAGFTRIWCQNLTRVKRWANGQEDIPPWVPIALTAMRAEGVMRQLRTAAAAMIEYDRMHPELGQFPYKKLRDMPEEDGDEPIIDHISDKIGDMQFLTIEQHRKKHER